MRRLQRHFVSVKLDSQAPHVVIYVEFARISLQIFISLTVWGERRMLLLLLLLLFSVYIRY